VHNRVQWQRVTAIRLNHILWDEPSMLHTSAIILAICAVAAAVGWLGSLL